MPPTVLAQLGEYRASVNLLDNAILSLMAERIRVVKNISALKREHHLPFLDRKRWAALMRNRMTKGQELGIDPNFIRVMYQHIHDHGETVAQSHLGDIQFPPSS